ncbi:MAG TPA: DUF4290 domain-containing protein [Prolixibacteraceae bacterium]|nr:DUF4290 domain-containing protein [Prolixibacteraceae bacterium]
MNTNHDSKDYNTSRKKLPLPEYGRNVQNMVNLILAIDDKETRNKAAKAIIDVMGSLYPYLRDVPDFKHKLWDHLAIMADFKLDIDYPYDPPSPDILTEKPNQVPYPHTSIKYRYYGKTIELMIQKAMEFEDGPEKDVLIYQLANHMKKSYLSYNKEYVDDVIIFQDLANLSNGKLTLVDQELADVKAIPQKQNYQKQKTQKKGNQQKRHK